MANDKIDEAIAKLPEVLQPLGAVYGAALARWTDGRIDAWMRLALDRGWRKAHEAIQNAMTINELDAEAKLGNNIIRQLNGGNSDFVAAQKKAIIELLITIGLAVIAKL